MAARTITKWEEEEEMKNSGIYYKIRYLQPGELDIDEK